MVGKQGSEINSGANAPLASDLAEKLARLEQIIQEMGSVAVGYSGGIDSSLVAWVAGRLLGDKMLAVTIRSPVESPEETELAVQIAQQTGFRHRVVDMDDLADPIFVANPPDRCYHCKLRRFSALQGLASEEGLQWIADGSNIDDADVYRPGRRAMAELGVRSPLSQAGLNKADIRQIARALGLPNWNKPAAPCLATRFPYNTQLTRAGIERVGKAEAILHNLGFRQVRVRVHDPGTPDREMARIEVEFTQFPALISQRETIVAALHDLGFRIITLDLLGFRSGSMDNGLLAQQSGSVQPNNSSPDNSSTNNLSTND